MDKRLSSYYSLYRGLISNRSKEFNIKLTKGRFVGAHRHKFVAHPPGVLSPVDPFLSNRILLILLVVLSIIMISFVVSPSLMTNNQAFAGGPDGPDDPNKPTNPDEPTDPFLPKPAVPASAIAIQSGAMTNINITPSPGDGVANASHDNIYVATTNITGYNLRLSTNSTTNKLIHTTSQSHVIEPIDSDNSVLGTNTWGYTMANPDDPATANFNIVPTSVSPVIIKTTNSATTTKSLDDVANIDPPDVTKIYYGAKVNAAQPAGDYKNTVVYTAIANSVSAPTITGVSPNQVSASGGENITITGTNLNSVVVDGIKLGENICENIQIISSTRAQCTAPAGEAGVVDVTVTNQGGTANLANGLEYESPFEAFMFTIDTRLDVDGNASEAETNFIAPLGGYVGGDFNHDYNWSVNCDTKNTNKFVNYEGISSPEVDDVACNYATPGEYQITIRSTDNAMGWMDAFGLIYIDDSRAIKLRSIDTPLTNNMRTKGSQNRFLGMFYGARNAVGVPADLFSNVLIDGGDSFAGMFADTFYEYAYNSEVATIPAGLFDSIDTSGLSSGDVDLGYMFAGTFGSYAYNSRVATIPAGLFDSVDISGLNEGASLEGMFSKTFYKCAYNSEVATIPTGLFSGINTSGLREAYLGWMFHGTFSSYAYNSRVATIPAGLFDSIDTGNLNQHFYIGSLFQETFMNYAYGSTVGTIPNNLFTKIVLPPNRMGMTTNYMFNQTFSHYAYANKAYDGTPDTDINNIWGDANLNIDDSITGEHERETLFRQTFYNMPSLVGKARTFINNKVSKKSSGGWKDTFYGTSVSDLATL